MILSEDQASRISADGLIHDAERLKELQALPLERKIGISIARIIEWYQHWNGNVCVSFSGGKDSTVLLHLVRSIFPEVPAVFSNTGLEYPEIQKFVRGFDNVTVVYPKINFKTVITEYGYPLISKEVAECIHYARKNANKGRMRKQVLMGTYPRGGLEPQPDKRKAEPTKSAIWHQRELMGVRTMASGGGGRRGATRPRLSKPMSRTLAKIPSLSGFN